MVCVCVCVCVCVRVCVCTGVVHKTNGCVKKSHVQYIIVVSFIEVYVYVC